MSGETDFDFLHRDWTVRHRKLTTRLAGADDWVNFSGTSTTRPILGGAGNVEDNFIDEPNGAYRASALRAFDRGIGMWRIWWLDLRRPSEIGPPVVGRFNGGRGEFIADDLWQDAPIKLRFVWLKDSPTGPVWEQSFSPDGGVTWELNWTMHFV